LPSFGCEYSFSLYIKMEMQIWMIVPDNPSMKPIGSSPTFVKKIRTKYIIPTIKKNKLILVFLFKNNIPP